MSLLDSAHDHSRICYEFQRIYFYIMFAKDLISVSQYLALFTFVLILNIRNLNNFARNITPIFGTSA